MGWEGITPTPPEAVKPINLIRWLVRLVTPPGGLVVDPYVGSGTTGVAAMREEGGFRFLGIERDPEYVPIAVARIRHVAGGQYRTPAEIATEAAAAPDGQPKQLPLF